MPTKSSVLYKVQFQRPGFVPAFFLLFIDSVIQGAIINFVDERSMVTETLMTRNAKDFWTGLIYICFGASAIIIARDYSMGTALRMGPAFFPTILGGLLVFIGAISVIRSFVVTGTPIGAVSHSKGSAWSSAVGRRLWLPCARRGTGVALPLLVIISAYASTRFRWRTTLIMAAGLTIFCVLVFVKGLGIPLPIIGPWLGS